MMHHFAKSGVKSVRFLQYGTRWLSNRKSDREAQLTLMLNDAKIEKLYKDKETQNLSQSDIVKFYQD